MITAIGKKYYCMSIYYCTNTIFLFLCFSRPFHDGFLDDVGSSSVFGSDPFPGYDLQSSTPRSRSPNVNVEKTIKMTLNLPGEILKHEILHS